MFIVSGRYNKAIGEYWGKTEQFFAIMDRFVMVLAIMQQSHFDVKRPPLIEIYLREHCAFSLQHVC